MLWPQLEIIDATQWVMWLSKRCVALFAVSLASSAALSQAPAPSTRVFQSHAVVDHTGVVIHLSFFNTPYGKFDAIVRPRIRELGIRNARDAALTQGNPGFLKTYYTRVRTLASDGVRFSLVTFDGTTPAYETDLSRLEQLYEWSGRSVDYFEGSNEPNLKGRADWPSLTRRHQTRLFASVRESRLLQGAVSVVGPSPWGKTAAQIGDLSGLADLGNWHIYSGGLHPESSGAASLKDYLRQAADVYGTRPVVATEAGYHSALSIPHGKHRPTPENVVARYLPRLILWNLKNNVVKTYLYELIDSFDRGQTDAESNFGLLRFDGTPKPSFLAVKNLLQIFDDPAKGDFRTDFPEVQMTDADGRNIGSGVEQMRFQKRDGTSLLAVWIAKPSWDPDKRVTLNVEQKRLVVKLTKAQETVLHSFNDNGSTSTATARTDAIQIDVDDHLRILEIRK